MMKIINNSWKPRWFAVLVSTLSLFLSGCSQPPEIQRVSGYAQGTTYHISWWSEKPVATETISGQFDQMLAVIDKELSTYRPDSFISLWNKNPSTDWQPASADFIHLLSVAKTIHHQTQGCYDPTIGPLFALWGFKKDVLQVPDPQKIAAVQAEIGIDKIEVSTDGLRIRKTLPGLQLDFSSMGEGYTISKLSQILETNGITNYLVEFGGDMKIRGHKPEGQKWRIAIERPVPSKDKRIPYQIVVIEDENGVTLDTSGTYHHSFDADGKAYSHILDPRTGSPVMHDLVSASVFGQDSVVSDAWATAMLCLGPKAGQEIADAEHLPVFFIQSRQEKLIASQSQALKTSKQVKLVQQ
ncbi:Thiamine biosynthesis lipoprotein ApbE precursor [Vibrio aerogenes CECT 7868]|uniref:FAD:protein FMN transferase n=1 Tax=Vibrio aerogenes CECT 7868 TaxID=1216006 RepID=A0A1M6C6D9_9VIBR|nr:FAD:protein FMN transferase [Vibrio aerogenes]SHI56576.1 Thiamine biosynthesis lipoprotein ApbE precursor [Vibrio aerogenes CECT 7868]